MKKKKYGHIKKEERLEMSILLGKGYGIRDIGKALGRSPSSVSEEIRKNSINGKYDPKKANHKAYVKRKYSKFQGMKIWNDNNLFKYIEEKIKEGWSPELISGRIKEVNCGIKKISFKGIYKFLRSVPGSSLQRYVNKKKKKNKKGVAKTSWLEDRIFIDDRPKIIDNRGRFGDWEGDFIVSGKNGSGVLLTLYERKSRYTLIRKILVQNIERVHRVFEELTGGIILNSLTLDNDIVFRRHKVLSGILNCPVYFCHPYHSWEKGGVENTNKMIRKYIPKGSDISKYSVKYIQTVENKLNNRPRKCLRFKTPREIMIENDQLKNINFKLCDILKVEDNKKAECSA